MPNTIQTAQQDKVLFNFQGPSGANAPANIAGAVQFTPEGMLNGSGWKSDVYDLGTTRNNLFEWRAKAVNKSSAPTLGNTVEIYFATSDDNGNWDANLGSGNATVTNTDKRRNLAYVGSLTVDQAATGIPFISSGLIQTYARYVAVVWYNMTGQPLSSTQGDCLFQLTPVPDQIESF